jgi:hypothetical protein
MKQAARKTVATKRAVGKPDPAVDAVFADYPKPVKARLLALRRLILDTARATKGVGAVEQQGSATREIARSVQQAAAGTSEVTLNVTGASQAAAQSRILANNVLVASGELNQHANALFESVDTFLAGLRDAA